MYLWRRIIFKSAFHNYSYLVFTTGQNIHALTSPTDIILPNRPYAILYRHFWNLSCLIKSVHKISVSHIDVQYIHTYVCKYSVAVRWNFVNHRAYTDPIVTGNGIRKSSDLNTNHLLEIIKWGSDFTVSITKENNCSIIGQYLF